MLVLFDYVTRIINNFNFLIARTYGIHKFLVN